MTPFDDLLLADEAVSNGDAKPPQRFVGILVVEQNEIPAIGEFSGPPETLERFDASGSKPDVATSIAPPADTQQDVQTLMLRGTEDGDVLVACAEDTVVLGLGGDDNMISVSGASALCGGSGYDLLQSEIGGDTLLGGDDPDTFLLWIDTMTVPSRIADFATDDMLVLVGTYQSAAIDGATLMIDGRAIATFSGNDAAEMAAFWVAL